MFYDFLLVTHDVMLIINQSDSVKHMTVVIHNLISWGFMFSCRDTLHDGECCKPYRNVYSRIWIFPKKKNFVYFSVLMRSIESVYLCFM